MRTSQSQGFYNSKQNSSKLGHQPSITLDEDSKQVVITDEMVFRAAMSRDYRNMQELSINQEQINFLDSNNPVLRQLVTLRKLDLSFNRILKIDNLDSLKELRELNLSFNLIETIDNLHKIPQLRSVNLNQNKIRQLENLRGLRKLEILSIAGNLLEDLTISGGGEPLLELKEINAGKNKIQVIKSSFSLFPNVRNLFSLI